MFGYQKSVFVPVNNIGLVIRLIIATGASITVAKDFKLSIVHMYRLASYVIWHSHHPHSLTKESLI